MMPFSRGLPQIRRHYDEEYEYGMPRTEGFYRDEMPHGRMPRREMSYGGMSHEEPWRSKMMREPPPDQNRPMSVNCRELRPHNAGRQVHMKGHMQFQRLNRFISLRDSHGTTQLVALEERLDLIKRIPNIPINSYIEIIGTVQRRPKSSINTTMETGEVEVIIDEILDVAPLKRKRIEYVGEDAPGRTGKTARSSVLVTRGELSRCETDAVVKKFHQRTHNCGELDETKVNSDVTLCGWVESKRGDKFIVLRDGYGSAQLVTSNTDPVVMRVVQAAAADTLITVKGRVSLRPSHQRNSRMASGNIEVKVSAIEIINPNEQKPVTNNDVEVTLEVEESVSSDPPPGDVNSYSKRTHTCGQLRGRDVGKNVILCGWLHSQRTNKFAIIRDGHGFTQLIIPTELESTVGKEMSKTALESVIMVTGTVCARPPEQVTETTDTGEVEVVLKEFSLLNPAKKDMPFVVRDHNRPKENLRMKYRYIDLRFTDMQHRLRLRSQVLMRMREFLINQRGFVEVETPTLFKRTPGGAQEYVVPTRMEDKFYSLVQSPQQLKQLLMVGAIDRYFQVARCYRDEGARPDRQPEFTQMDIEMSFTDRDSIMSLIEDLIKASWPQYLKALSTPFPIISYCDAMHWYGTDKPDLSFEKKLIDISELISEENKISLPEDVQDIKNFTAKALVFSINEAQKLKESFEQCEELQKLKPKSKAKLILVKCTVTKWQQDLDKALPFLNSEKLKTLLEFSIPSTVVVGVGEESRILPLLGKLRSDVFRKQTLNYHFAWIVDFPLFLKEDDGSLASAHHPFTQAHPEDSKLLLSDPLKVRGQHFDLVLNGFEVGGGSVRIHDAAVQRKVLKDILKIPLDSLEHLLEALESGAPPHGGIALGMDRLLSVLVGAESIRDVIAFPKGVDGKDPLCGAPCAISDAEKQLYHLMPKKT